MKEIDLLNKSKKLCKNYAFNLSDGETVLLELFTRLNFIQKKELVILCERLLETDEFQEYLHLNDCKTEFDSFEIDDDTEGDFEQSIQEKERLFTQDIFEDMHLNAFVDIEDDFVDVPVPLYNQKCLKAFQDVCLSMQKEGYLNAADLPSAMQVMKEFMPLLSLKSYEYASWTYTDKTQLMIENDMKRCNGVHLSNLSDCQKVNFLSSIIYATVWDFNAKDKAEQSDKLQVQLTEALFGLPEYFYHNALERINRKLERDEKNVITSNVRGFMATRLKQFFQSENLSLKERVLINEDISKIAKLSFNDAKSWNAQIRPLLVNISKNMPYYLKKNFQISVAENLRILYGVVSNSDLKQQNGIQILVGHISKCFRFGDRIKSSNILLHFKRLENLAYHSIAMNPCWSREEKSKYFDFVCDMKITEKKKISQHKSIIKKKEGRSHE